MTEKQTPFWDDPKELKNLFITSIVLLMFFGLMLIKFSFDMKDLTQQYEIEEDKNYELRNNILLVKNDIVFNVYENCKLLNNSYYYEATKYGHSFGCKLNISGDPESDKFIKGTLISFGTKTSEILEVKRR